MKYSRTYPLARFNVQTGVYDDFALTEGWKVDAGSGVGITTGAAHPLHPETWHALGFGRPVRVFVTVFQFKLPTHRDANHDGGSYIQTCLDVFLVESV